MAKSDSPAGPDSSRKSTSPKVIKPSSTPAAKKSGADRRKPVRLDSPRWLVPLMLVLFAIGLIWIVAYYVAPDAPGINVLGWWNEMIGFAFLPMWFVVSTKWR